MKKGKFIVIYGINNIGKTTQAKLLLRELKRRKMKAEYLKYPVYAQEPAGKLINEYLRKSNPYNFSPREFQLLHYIDRLKFETSLEKKLNQGINIIAEDYFGTAVAWGTAAGVERKLLEYLYKFIRKEDLAILLDGKIFKNNLEKNNRHEIDEKLTEKSRRVHLSVGKKYGWKIIKANASIPEVQECIFGEVSRILRIK